MTNEIKKPVAAFALELSDAYSTYTCANGWGGCIKMLRARGYNDREIEAIIRSKWTRWAADASSKPSGKNTSTALAEFLDDPRNFRKGLPAAVAELVAQTFE